MRNKLRTIHFAFDSNFSGKICSSKNISIDPNQKEIFLGIANNYGERLTLVNNLISKDVVSVTRKDIQDKSFYRLPNLKLPRMKLDILKEECNISIVRDADKADYIICSNKHIEKITQDVWSHVITLQDFKNFLNNDINFQSLFTTQALIDMRNAITNFDESDVMLVKYDVSWGNDDAGHMESRIHTALELGKRRYVFYVPSKNINAFKYYMDCDNLVLDTKMVELCNSNLHVLTEEELETFDSIFKSNGNDTDKAMALEMMANCNIEKCLDKVAYLYYFNFELLKYASNWNHVNVKTLRKALEEFEPRRGIHHISYYEEIIKKIANQGMLTEYVFKKIITKMVIDGLSTFGFNNSKIFKLDPDKIDLTSEIKSKIIGKESGKQILESITLDDSDDLPF